MLHELWHETEPERTGYCLCLAGPRGDQSRSMLSEHAQLVWTFEAASWFEAMVAFYDYMGWGEYTPMDAELDGITYAEKGWEK